MLTTCTNAWRTNQCIYLAHLSFFTKHMIWRSTGLYLCSKIFTGCNTLWIKCPKYIKTVPCRLNGSTCVETYKSSSKVVFICSLTYLVIRCHLYHVGGVEMVFEKSFDHPLLLCNEIAAHWAIGQFSNWKIVLEEWFSCIFSFWEQVKLLKL